MGTSKTNYKVLEHMDKLLEEDGTQSGIYETWEKRYKITQRGLPQGLSWSPLLANIVSSYALKDIPGTPILYADDGVIISNTPIEELEQALKQKEPVYI